MVVKAEDWTTSRCVFTGRTQREGSCGDRVKVCGPQETLTLQRCRRVETPDSHKQNKNGQENLKVRN